ncbi:hypothetical protein LCGC14_2191390, partial [marine sediment metagenome]
MPEDRRDREALEVCHLTTSHRAIDNRLFYNEACSLARAGYRTAIIGQHERREILEGVEIIPLSTDGRRRSMIGRMMRALRIAIKEKAALYHFHDPELIPVGVVLKLLGKKVIWDAHEDYQSQLMSRNLPAAAKTLLARCWWVFEKNASRFFDHVITADSQTEGKFSADKATTIANFPPAAFGDVERGESTSDTLRIAYIGGISRERGLVKVVEALDHLKGEPVEFHIAGDTSDPELLKLFSEHPKVVYHGRVPWKEVPRYLASAEVGVVLLQP